MKVQTISSYLGLTAAVTCLWLAGCGGKSAANQVLVSVSPATATLVVSQSFPFTATVTGATDTSVVWTCTYTTTTTTISSTGTLTSTTSTPLPCPADNSWGKFTDPTQTTLTYTAPSKLPAVTVSTGTFVTAYTVTLTATANADKKKSGTATISLDSGIRVTITPLTATLAVGVDTAKFTASSPNETKPLNWFLTQKPSTQAAGTTFTPNPASTPCVAATCGSVDATTGIYTPPTSLPTDVTVYVVVNSVTDTTRYAFATITLIKLSSGPITFSGISPDKAPWGGQQQDIYLIGNNLRSSTNVTFNGTSVAPSQITVVTVPTSFCTASTTVTCTINSLVTRLRLNAANLSAISAPGDVQITVAGVTSPQTLHLVAARPSIVTATPDSFPQNTTFGSSNTFNVNGGYFGLFGTGTNSAVKVEFNGQSATPTNPSSRQLIADLSTFPVPTVPGLYPVAVIGGGPVPPSTPLATQPMAVTNLAIQPTTFSTSPTSIPLASNTAFPSAIAVDSNLGYAVVAETGADQVEIFNLAGGVPAHVLTASIPADIPAAHTRPTGIAIDDQLTSTSLTTSLSAGNHLAVLANNGDGSLSFIEVPSGKRLTTNNLDLSKLIPPTTGSTTTPAPYSVGIDPISHLALIAFNNSSVGFIVQLDPNPKVPTKCLTGNTPPLLVATGIASPYCAIASVSLNTGTTPQIAFEPRLHAAYVSPGGRGTFSVVDLKQQQSSSASIAAAPGGAIRANNIVTIKTLAAHGIDPILGGSVLISGLPPGTNGTSFNGAFQVPGLGVLDSTTFQYVQTGIDDTGGSTSASPGVVGVAAGARTFFVSSAVTGIAINPETRSAVFADPNATSAQIGFISSLDQSISSLTLSVDSFGTTIGGAPETGARFVAYQPYNNVAVSFNPSRDEISFLDPSGLTRIVHALKTNQKAIPCSPATTMPPCSATTLPNIFGAMAVDPQTNLVLVANAGSNTLTYLDMGAGSTRQAIQISQILPIMASYGVPNSFLAQATLSTNSTPAPPALPVPSFRILGRGFLASNLKVRLDQMAISTFTVLNDKEIDFSVPATPEFPGGPSQQFPRVFALDVVADAGHSNVTDFSIVGTLDLSGCGTTDPTLKPTPSAVAIDEQRDVALVTNPGCAVAGKNGTTVITNAGTVSIVGVNATIPDPNNPGQTLPNPNYGKLLATIPVGVTPTGVAVIPRLGYAAVTNQGGGTVTVLDIHDPKNPSKVADVTVGTAPSGVAIDQDTGVIIVANTGDNTVSTIDLTVLQKTPAGTLTANRVAVDAVPMAVAVDPARQIAVVTALQFTGIGSTTFGVLDVIDLSVATPIKSSTKTLSGLTAIPTGLAFDAVTPGLFYATSSFANAVYAFNPDTGQTSQIRVGVNPTSIAYNPNTGTLLTVNSSSNTISVVDSQTFRTRATLGIGSQSQFAAAIHSRTNLAVIADQTNNRLLLLPLPK
jgi:DNA-binding beta-propeller fold protein YncE